MHLSYSKIRTYLESPRKFKFIYIDRIPQKPKLYFRFSYIIHHTLQIYDFYQKTGLNELLMCYEDVFRSSNEKSERLYQEGREILINFYHAFPDIISYKVEERFKVKLGPHILCDKIDRVDKINESYELIDYKTSKSIPIQELKGNLQLNF